VRAWVLPVTGSTGRRLNGATLARFSYRRQP